MCNLRMVGGRMTGRRTLNRVGLVFALIRFFFFFIFIGKRMGAS